MTVFLETIFKAIDGLHGSETDRFFGEGADERVRQAALCADCKSRDLLLSEFRGDI